ncbi:uncharacterized protein LOC109848149 [Asparagus officinalis]|nr:uncharacterized protein LOC109848149 [Asparagus officinalis]
MERRCGLKLLPDILSNKQNLERMTRIYIMHALTKELEKLPKIPGIQSPLFGAVSSPAVFPEVLLVYRTFFSLCIVKGDKPLVPGKGERKHREWKHSGTWLEAGQITNILFYGRRFYCLCSMRRLILVGHKDGALSVEVLDMDGDNLPAEETTIQLLFESNTRVHAAILHKNSADPQSISSFQLFQADLKNNKWVEIYGLSNKKILVISNAYSCSSLANRINYINLSPAFFRLSTGTMDMRAASTSICEFHNWTVWRKGAEWIALSISCA